MAYRNGRHSNDIPDLSQFFKKLALLQPQSPEHQQSYLRFVEDMKAHRPDQDREWLVGLSPDTRTDFWQRPYNPQRDAESIKANYDRFLRGNWELDGNGPLDITPLRAVGSIGDLGILGVDPSRGGDRTNWWSLDMKGGYLDDTSDSYGSRRAPGLSAFWDTVVSGTVTAKGTPNAEPIVAPKQFDITGKPFAFVRGYNSFTRSHGWKPQEIPDFDPVAPAMMLHDILEHFQEGTAEVYWEYQALGAAHFIRHEGGYFGSKRISDELVKPAFGMLFHHIMSHGLKTKPCPLEGQAVQPLNKLETDFEIQRTIANARDFLHDTYPPTAEKQKIDASLQHALGWMRLGYHRARERFEGVRPQQLSRLFVKMQSEIEALSKQANESSSIVITLDPARETGTIEFKHTVV